VDGRVARHVVGEAARAQGVTFGPLSLDPDDRGVLGVTMTEDVQLAFEFGYTTPAFRSLFGTNNGIAGQVIAKFGSEAQQQRYLPGMAEGVLIGAFALTHLLHVRIGLGLQSLDIGDLRLRSDHEGLQVALARWWSGW